MRLLFLRRHSLRSRYPSNDLLMLCLSVKLINVGPITMCWWLRILWKGFRFSWLISRRMVRFEEDGPLFMVVVVPFIRASNVKFVVAMATLPGVVTIDTIVTSNPHSNH
ncbi:hypothetical protein V6Z12_A03G169900 [Gossypium hirsutum]